MPKRKQPDFVITRPSVIFPEVWTRAGQLIRVSKLHVISNRPKVLKATVSGNHISLIPGEAGEVTLVVTADVEMGDNFSTVVVGRRKVHVLPEEPISIQFVLGKPSKKEKQ